MAESLIDEKAIATELSHRAIDRILSFGESLIKKYWARHNN